jgi:hypothetical protein
MQILRVVRLGAPVLLGVLAGCATLGSSDRALLARPEMALDAYPLDTTLAEQMYHSREGQSGGRRLAPGVCGCK